MKVACGGLLLALCLGFVFAPFASEAQRAGKTPRIGLFVFTPALREAFIQGLHDAGYVDGQNIIVEQRTESSLVPVEKLVEELVALKVDVLVTSGAATSAVKKVTNTKPIVAIDLYNDPVASGFVATYARPGGNVTGLFLDLPELAGKHLQILREMLPGLRRVAVLWDDRTGGPYLRVLEAAARSTNVTIHSTSVHREDELANALDRVVAARPQALIGFGSVISRNLKHLADTAVKHRLPTITVYTGFPEAGGLIGYGPNFPNLWRRAAVYVDRILKGAQPGDLPIERPVKYELLINRRTAKTLGLTIPSLLLLQADHLIE